MASSANATPAKRKGPSVGGSARKTIKSEDLKVPVQALLARQVQLFDQWLLLSCSHRVEFGCHCCDRPSNFKVYLFFLDCLLLSHARGSKLNEHTTIDNYFAQALGTEACKILNVCQRFDGLSCVSILVCFLLTSDIVTSRPRGPTFGNGLPGHFHPRNMSEALSDFVGGGGERHCCNILGPVTCVSRELCCRGSMRRWLR